MVNCQEDKIISEFLDTIGPWREHVVIGGGFALFIYNLYFSDQKLKNLPAFTRDIDTLISRKVTSSSKKDISEYLSEAGFEHVFRSFTPITESYRKEIDGIEIDVEFLTDDAVRKDKHENVVVAGIVAQPLRYLTLSLQTTLKFQTYSHKTGRVVSPGAWIFHKGLTFKYRKVATKKLKDLYGIWYVATQLGSFSKQALNEFNILTKHNPKWFVTLKNNLINWIENSSVRDLSNLKDQDPSGNLTEVNFDRMIKSLIGELP